MMTDKCGNNNSAR